MGDEQEGQRDAEVQNAAHTHGGGNLNPLAPERNAVDDGAVEGPRVEGEVKLAVKPRE